MLLTEVFDHLRYGPLKGHSVSREGASIEEIDYPRLITCINSGLVALYGKYKLAYKEVLVRIIADKFIYELHTDFAESNISSTEPVRWIVDSEETPFTNTIVRIHSVTDDKGNPLTVNDNTDVTSVMTPTYNSIQLPPEVVAESSSVSVVFEASPETLPAASDLAPEVTEVKIPLFMLEALGYYTASKFMESSTSQDKSFKAQEFMQKFELKCNEMKDRGMITEEAPEVMHLGVNEWP